MTKRSLLGIGVAAFALSSMAAGYAITGPDDAAVRTTALAAPHPAGSLPVARVVPGHAALGLDAPPTLAQQEGNVPYDGKFTFVRVRTDQGGRGMSGFGRWRGRGQPGWAHDYPRAERNFEKILEATTMIDTYMEGSNIITLDDPELFKFPIAYVSEPGQWNMSEEEEEGLRNYFLKGGFVIFDDFRGRDFRHFSAQLAPRAPRGTAHRPGHPQRASGDLQLLLRDHGSGEAHVLRRRLAAVLWHLRGQRPLEASHVDRQLQQRPRGLLGVFRLGMAPHRSDQQKRTSSESTTSSTR